MSSKYDEEAAKKLLLRAVLTEREAYDRAVEFFFSRVLVVSAVDPRIRVKRCALENLKAMEVQLEGRPILIVKQHPPTHLEVLQGRALALKLIYDRDCDRFVRGLENDDDTDALVALAAACAGQDPPS